MMSNEYRFEMMMDDSSDHALWSCTFDDGLWEYPQTKITIAEDLSHFVSTYYGIDISAMTVAFCDDVRASGDFDEVGYFQMVENILNSKGIYTYNSDTWFEIYGTNVPITPKQLEESLA